MNNIQHQETVKNAVKARFRGHTALQAKTPPLYPSSAEREFQRVSNAYMRRLRQALKKHLPAMLRSYKRERRSDARYDGRRELEEEIRREILKIADEIGEPPENFALPALLEKVAAMTRENAIRCWRRAVRDTLGVDLLDDYYRGEFYEEALKRWVADNVLMIKTIPGETLGRMQEIILDGYLNGMTIRALQRAIQGEYDVTKRKAALLARDQIATLNARITQLQQQDAGCTKYRWSSSKDERVRECHRELDGKVFSWDSPPEMWYRTKKSGVVHTGRRCHPGEDYCCRCVAIPVFDFSTLNIPMAGEVT